MPAMTWGLTVAAAAAAVGCAVSIETAGEEARWDGATVDALAASVAAVAANGAACEGAGGVGGVAFAAATMFFRPVAQLLHGLKLLFCLSKHLQA